mgnify:CR=1 FL=1
MKDMVFVGVGKFVVQIPIVVKGDLGTMLSCK